MSVNKYKPHVFVLPEDTANREIANGFLLHGKLNPHAIQVMPTLSGWPDVRDTFQKEYINWLRKYPDSHVVLLVDFDEHSGAPAGNEVPGRLADMRQVVPDDVRDRVFVLGAWPEPEALKAAGLGSFEVIGLTLADDCRTDRQGLWDHELLRHNAGELERMKSVVKPFLFRD